MKFCTNSTARAPQLEEHASNKVSPSLDLSCFADLKTNSNLSLD